MFATATSNGTAQRPKHICIHSFFIKRSAKRTNYYSNDFEVIFRYHISFLILLLLLLFFVFMPLCFAALNV